VIQVHRVFRKDSGQQFNGFDRARGSMAIVLTTPSPSNAQLCMDASLPVNDDLNGAGR
jgi:hypothetical protein